MKKYLGIYIIAIYLLFDGSIGLSNLLPILQNGNVKTSVLLMLIYRIGIIVAAIGLMLLSGWGRNSTIFFNGISAIYCLMELLQHYFSSSLDTPVIIYEIISFATIGGIFYYLFRYKVKELFPEHPVSWCVLGLLLSAFAMWGNDSENIIISSFWHILWIVGLAITGYGAKKLHNSYPQDPIYSYPKK